MARSNVVTLLPLDRYAALMGLNLAHFNNLDDGQVSSVAVPFWNQALHDLLAQYVAEAEANLVRALGFDVAPAYRRERIRFQPDTAEFYRWMFAEVCTSYQHVQAFGQRAVSVLAEDASVTFEADTATVTAPVPAGTDPAEVRVFYREADGASGTAGARWYIRPLAVRIGGTTATIRGHKAQFVRPVVLEGTAAAPYDQASSFVSQVDVCRVYTDPTLPLTLVWDALQVDEGGDPSTDATQTATAWPVNMRRGTFLPRPASYQAGAHLYEAPRYGLPPSHIDVAYLAGHPLQNGSIEPRLELAAARLANVLSPEFVVWVADLAKTRWRYDRNMPGDDNPLQEAELKNPFGFTNGARFAWRIVQEMRLPVTSGAMAV